MPQKNKCEVLNDRKLTHFTLLLQVSGLRHRMSLSTKNLSNVTSICGSGGTSIVFEEVRQDDNNRDYTTFTKIQYQV